MQQLLFEDRKNLTTEALRHREGQNLIRLLMFKTKKNGFDLPLWLCGEKTD